MNTCRYFGRQDIFAILSFFERSSHSPLLALMYFSAMSRSVAAPLLSSTYPNSTLSGAPSLKKVSTSSGVTTICPSSPADLRPETEITFFFKSSSALATCLSFKDKAAPDTKTEHTTQTAVANPKIYPLLLCAIQIISFHS